MLLVRNGWSSNALGLAYRIQVFDPCTRAKAGRGETAFNSRSAVPLGLEEIYDMERRGSAETAGRSRLARQEALGSQCPFSKPLLDRDSTED